MAAREEINSVVRKRRRALRDYWRFFKSVLNPLNVETHYEHVIRRVVMGALDDYMSRGMSEEQGLHILADFYGGDAGKMARQIQMLDQLEQRAKGAEEAEAVSNNNNVGNFSYFFWIFFQFFRICFSIFHGNY
jgi:hypothetical protein